MALTPQQLQNSAKPVTDIYSGIELAIMINIAERLGSTIEELQDNPALWQSNRFGELAEFYQRQRRFIIAQAPKAERELRQTLSKTALDHIEIGEKALQEAFDKGIVPVSPERLRDDPQMLSILSSYQQRARSDLNMINTSVLNGSQQVYRNIISETTSRVLTGQMTADRAIRSTLSKWSDKGIPTLTRSDGATLSAEGYVSMIVRSVTNDVTNDMQMTRIQQYGNDLIEVSSHIGARPRCAPFQGRIFSLSGNSNRYPAWSSTSYGEAAGLLGVNCGHQIYPFFEGLSVAPEPPKQTAEQNAEAYKESQRQRQLERDIRKAKNRQDILAASGDVVGAEQARKLIRQRQGRMRGFIDESGRTRRYGREQIQRSV
ncbi:minor capsid protein [Paenalkalicoccus suaedae]|uniref:Minor capsid protein n=1 Tax=Paenalkalicoccus suaedae TaxID=2592382 RepID=A0A859FER9_9BACI|nr:phage minor capsid protein [Paenalkalicoccus suaedae]QKS71669.1 minor capsid protein [Paenalkalicoccus suaedae]QKS71722.1 minor capsid protein [Paenalkalicoccus suaedae]